MALEQTGCETTAKWACCWSVDIWQMLEDLMDWIAAGEPEADDSVVPGTLMMNEIAREALW